MGLMLVGDGGDDRGAEDGHWGTAGVLPAAGDLAQGAEQEERGEGGLGAPGQ